MFSSPSIPSFSFDKHLTCQDVWVVYAIKCTQCDKLYVGQTDKPKARWSNHKSHVRCARETCNFATHCVSQHSDLMVGDGKLMQASFIKEHIQFTILDKALDCTEQTLCRLEESWRNKLKSWVSNGVNSRNDGPKELRKKTIIKWTSFLAVIVLIFCPCTVIFCVFCNVLWLLHCICNGP